MTQVKVDGEQIIPEDDVTNSMIERVGREHCYVEVPYNNYGSRGYVDLVIDKTKTAWVHELKSNPSQANQVIRQFKKMKENFVQGKSLELDAKTARFFLIFTASDRNLQHIKENKNMYVSLNQEARCSVRMAGPRGVVAPVFYEGEIDRSKIADKIPSIAEEDDLVCPYCGKEYDMKSYYLKHVKECFE